MSSGMLPPPPNGQVLSLVSALSNPENHQLHLQAIKARDEALSASAETYGNLCLQLSYLMVGCDNPHELLPKIDPSQLEAWRQTDMSTAMRLQSDPNLWIPFGQMAGLILKGALLRPPILPTGQSLYLQPPVADHVKQTLLYGLGCQHADLRNVASSVIATSSVSPDGVQPAMFIDNWPQLVPSLLSVLQQQQQQPSQQQLQQNRIEGALSTIKKMMEDGPKQFQQEHLDEMIPILIRFLSSSDERSKVSALQSIVACLNAHLMPSALVLQFSDYLNGLSALATDPSPLVRKWVCRSINTLLEVRTEYVQEHVGAICQFMMQATADLQHDSVAMEACEFWLIFANLEEDVVSSNMLETVEGLLPQLIPLLLRNMVYTEEQKQELLARNELDQQEGNAQQQMRPVFHRSKNKHGGGSGSGNDGDDNDEDGDDDDDDEFDDEDGSEWTLRKYAGASLDSLANLYGAEPILPPLLPSLQQGLSSSDPWVQEASILALGAIADGCCEEMSVHMPQLHPYLMTHLATPETPDKLPQLKSIAAWTIGRYSAWAVNQVQTGAQGHLLAQMTEIFLQRLGDKNRRVQAACCSAFGVMVEAAGDLMAPYLEPIFQGLISAMSRYQGRSLIIAFDTIGIVADFCGPAIGERNLPQLYVPPMMQMWDGLAKNDPTDRTLLPLMESLSSIALVCGMNYQPYALETFEMAMGTIEQVQMILAASGGGVNDKVAEEDADPIVCAVDLLDGLCEGLGGNFATLVASSTRYAQHFQSVLHGLCKHDLVGIRTSALALLGDLARNAPSLIEPVLGELLQAAISNLDPMHPSACNNSVWAIGEICVRCGENSTPLAPFASSLMQELISLLMGNGPGRSVDIPGLSENAAACVGRLANLNPNFVAPELSRFLLGWCDGMAKITDPTERRDAYNGFASAIYANPQSIQQAAAVTASGNVADSISSILFAIVSWHMPPETPDQPEDLLSGNYDFSPFPQTEVDLGNRLAQLMRDIKSSVGDDTWTQVQNQLPVNVRRLLREAYQL